MPRVRDISFIRKLCSIGLPAQTLAQCLLPELRKFIPSHSAGVFWVDQQGEMISLYAERLLPPSAMVAYYQKHYSAKAEGFAEAFRRRMEGPDPISHRSFGLEEQRTDYFVDIMKRLDAYHVLYGVLKDGTRPIAQISFYRGEADKSFDKDTRDTLRSLIRYLAAGLGVNSPTVPSEDVAIVAEEELGVVTSTGAFINAPESWIRLLRLATANTLSPRDASSEGEGMRLFVERVCEELLFGHKELPRRHKLTSDTPWGRFVIQAFPLSNPDQRPPTQVGILLRREEPPVLSLVRGTGVADLSPQQREVALLIVAGKSNPEIAKCLGLSLNTVNSHVKQVYARLDVNERAAVGRKLLLMAQAAMAY